MQRFDLIEKLKTAEDQAASLRGDIKAFVDQFIDSHRKYKDGQKVEVFDCAGKSYGIGFIKRAKCGVSFQWGFRPSDYIGRQNAEEKWLNDLTSIRYEIVKMKKDGTPSERTLMWDTPRQKKEQGQYYLTPVE